MRKTRFLLGVLAVAMIGLPGGSKALAAVDWKNLPYYDYPTNELFMATNSKWSSAHTVPFLDRHSSPQPYASRGVQSQQVWVQYCGTKAQTVIFSKTIDTPGAPYSGGFHLSYGSWARSLWGPAPYQSADLMVNGTDIAHLGAWTAASGTLPFVDGQLSQAQRAAFHEGANALSVRVQRAALPAGTQCNAGQGYISSVNPRSKNRYISVYANIQLSFGASLQPVKFSKSCIDTGHCVDAQSDEFIFKNYTPPPYNSALGSQTQVMKSDFTFLNQGPSSSLDGSFTIEVDNVAHIVNGQSTGAALTPPCTPDATVTRLTCPYQDFRSNTQQVIHTVIGVDMLNFGPSDLRTMSFSWSIHQNNDNWYPGFTPGHLDNTVAMTMVFCGPSAGARYSQCR